MPSSLTTAVRPPGLRTIMTALFLLIPAAALAADNGNLGTPQNDCEQRATNDYNANLRSCEVNLVGDPHSIAQCKTDFSYDYNDAIAACKNAAAAPGRPQGKFDAAAPGRPQGKFDATVDGHVTTQTPLGQSLKKGDGRFVRN